MRHLLALGVARLARLATSLSEANRRGVTSGAH